MGVGGGEGRLIPSADPFCNPFFLARGKKVALASGARLTLRLIVRHMTGPSPPTASDAPAYDVLRPEHQTLPLVLASPHSGRLYPPAFCALSDLSAQTLRRSEDSHVDELFAEAPRLGAPLLRAVYARAFLDLNREPYELDPDMFEDALPAHVNTTSPRVAAGLGTLARVVGANAPIYTRRLRFAEAEARIQGIHRPYHAALADLVHRTQRRFGACLLLDCHSMPTPAATGDAAPTDVVLGDCHGLACAPVVMDVADRCLTAAGLRVLRNTPYAGGYTTHHYGRPEGGVHALQIELARALYMNEATRDPTPGFAPLRALLTDLVRVLGALPLAQLLPRAAQ